MIATPGGRAAHSAALARRVCHGVPAPAKLRRVTAALEALVSEADIAVRERRWDDAARLLEAVLVQDPAHLRALDNLGYVRFFQGSYAEAEQACRRALALSPDHAYAHKGLGLCLARQGHLDEGVVSLERAIALEPSWLDPYWDLAIVLMEAGELDRATRTTERGAAAVPAARTRFAKLAAEIGRGPRPAGGR